MRRAFTLLELVTIVAIIGIMATVAVMGLNAGKGAARMRGASRDIYATIRHARSTALVTQQPAIITYSEKMVDGDICARVEITAARMMNGNGPQFAETISGDRVQLWEGEAAADAAGGGEGTSSEDFFFAPISDEVVKGIRIKVTKGDERVASERRDERRVRPGISVFSNVDYLLGRYNEERKSAEEKEAAEQKAAQEEAAAAATAAPAADAELQENVSIVWEVNGRCEAHTVWIYREGQQPDSGLCIKVDRFGGAKIMSSEDF